MRVLFIYPNISYSMTPQMGLLALGSYLISKSIEVKVCDLSFTPAKKFVDKIFQDVYDFDPDIIGISCRTMESGVAKALCREIKNKHPEKLLIAGGPHVTFKCSDFAQFVDFCVVGEGEETTLDIVNLLASSRSSEIGQLQNVAFVQNGNLISNPLRPLFDLSKTPMPIWSLFDERHYTKHYCLPIKKGTKVCGTFEGSRGCPFRCTYCSNEGLKTIYKGLGRWRREKPIGMIRNEMLDFKSKYNMDLTYFIDEVIMTSDERTKQYSDELASLDTPFIFMDRPELITEKRVLDMKKAGAYSCSIGVESANDNYRKEYLLRDMKDETIAQAYSLMKHHGILTHCFILLGMPGQTKEIIKQTFEMVRSLQPDSAQASTFFPLPGTKLETYCIEHDLLPKVLPTSYYGITSLKYDKELIKWITVYTILINMGAWKHKIRGRLLEMLGSLFPQVMPTIQNIGVAISYLQRQGLFALIKKSIAKIKFANQPY